MRLVMVTPQLPDHPGAPTLGVGTATAGLLLGLLAKHPDLDVHVVHAMADADGPARPWGDTPITLHPVATSSRALYAPINALRPQTVQRAVDRLRPDVVHVQGWASILDGRRYPSVMTVHGIMERDTYLRARHLRRLRAALVGSREAEARAHYRHLVAIAGYVAQQLEEQPHGRLHFIPNAIDPDYYGREGTVADTEPVILQLGVVIPRKNTLATVEAVGQLARAGVDCRLHLAGPRHDAAYADLLDARIADLGIAERVSFLGNLDREQVRAELDRARVLVLPSLQETAPMAIAEANARGVPAVVAPAGGAAEMVVDGWSGALVDPHSPASIADGLRPFVQSAEHAAIFGARARDLADRHRPERVADATRAIYDALERAR